MSALMLNIGPAGVPRGKLARILISIFLTLQSEKLAKPYS